MKCTKEYRLSFTGKAQKIIERLSLEEKVWFMSGQMSIEMMMESKNSPNGHYNVIPYPAGGNTALQIPPVLFCDGPRGVVCGIGKSTCFPVSMLRGASFDTELEEKIGQAIGREVRGFGGNLFGGVCVNLPYHPGWGRSQETYGEDSYLLGQMGAALVKGVQEEHVIACVKHYAFNSMEISRFSCSVECSRRAEREVFLPHFKDCIDAGAASVMTAYNRYKGCFCGESDYLINKVLKEEWDFDGFTMSDFFFGLHDTTTAANSGMDLEMCHTKYFGEQLIHAVKEGLVRESQINYAVLRIIRTLLAFEEAYKESNKQYNEQILGCPEHIALSLKSAQEGITLIQNNHNCLPYSKKDTKKILLLGKLAVNDNIGDYGSSRVYAAYNRTPLEGIKNLLPDAEIKYLDGTNIPMASETAKWADAVIFVVGFDHDDEGEYVSPNQSSCYTSSRGGDRVHGLGLHESEQLLIQTIGPLNPHSTVVLIGGNTITINQWRASVSSILMAYYPGQEGGTALAQILFGDINPSGHLPFVLPQKEEDLPSVNWDTTCQYYDYYHGYAKLEKEGVQPLLPFGYGLSYTTFACSDAHFRIEREMLVASCIVSNTGEHDGAQVVQVYSGFPDTGIKRPFKQLIGFKRITLNSHSQISISISCSLDRLKWYDTKTGNWKLDSGNYPVYIGFSAANEDLVIENLHL